VFCPKKYRAKQTKHQITKYKPPNTKHKTPIKKEKSHEKESLVCFGSYDNRSIRPVL
jgi:hypothetical protein